LDGATSGRCVAVGHDELLIVGEPAGATSALDAIPARSDKP
jgi:hypothetical protein